MLQFKDLLLFFIMIEMFHSIESIGELRSFYTEPHWGEAHGYTREQCYPRQKRPTLNQI